MTPLIGTMMEESFVANRTAAEARMLEGPEGAGVNESTVVTAIIMICCVVICCLWVPSRFVRSGVDQQQRNLLRRAARWRELFENHPNGMSIDDRRKYLSNILVTKKAVLGGEDAEDETNSKEPCCKSDLIIPAPSADTADDDLGDEECQYTSCAICLAAYVSEDEVCWSQNSECYHVFHRDCILEWLLRHDACPCCRHNFLAPNDGDTEEAQQQQVERVEGDDGEGTTQRSGSPPPVDSHINLGTEITSDDVAVREEHARDDEETLDSDGAETCEERSLNVVESLHLNTTTGDHEAL